MKRIGLDENWAGELTHKQAIRKMKRYYRLLRGLYPHIPPKAQFSFNSRIHAIADVGQSAKLVDMRFNSRHIKLYKLVVREFLHEMVHVIWPTIKHGAAFEWHIFRLRKELFHDSMIIY